MKIVQRWWDDSSIPKESTVMMREQVAMFVDAPVPRVDEHVYTHDPIHEWRVVMVRYNMEQQADAFVVDVQLEPLW